MQKYSTTILVALACAAAAASGCAAPPAPRGPQIVVTFDVDRAMREACLRKLSGQSPMTPAWRAYCKGRGLTLAMSLQGSSDRSPFGRS